jgi:hypothetical protein
MRHALQRQMIYKNRSFPYRVFDINIDWKI